MGVTTQTMTTQSASLVETRTRHGGRDRTMRVLDFTIALLGCLAALPLMLIAALAIRLTSPGPAVFRQQRLGLNGRTFTLLKLRTMRAGAPEAKHEAYVKQLIQDDGTQGGDRTHLYKLVVDDRVTRVGRWLRKTSLDELPQLWNVVRGQMSLVGPRPVIPYEAEIYPASYHERFSVKPGLTGLWQVSGRNRRTYTEMVELDIEFVRRRSLALYLAILLRTVPAVLFRKDSA
jgi:lipopolysaccharide/colanic/teichoic acid biosynthesis glycosyltransferase